MEFAKFPSIGNFFNLKHVTPDEYYCHEKLDGANFSFQVDLECGTLGEFYSRNCALHEKFFNSVHTVAILKKLAAPALVEFFTKQSFVAGGKAVQLYGELFGEKVHKMTYDAPRGWDDAWLGRPGPRQYFLAYDLKYTQSDGTDVFMPPQEFDKMAREFETAHEIPIQVFLPAERIIKARVDSPDDVRRVVVDMCARRAPKPTLFPDPHDSNSVDALETPPIEGVVFKRVDHGIESYFKYVFISRGGQAPAGASTEHTDLLDRFTEEACLKRASDKYYDANRGHWKLFFNDLFDDVMADAGVCNKKPLLKQRAQDRVRAIFPPARLRLCYKQ